MRTLLLAVTLAGIALSGVNSTWLDPDAAGRVEASADDARRDRSPQGAWAVAVREPPGSYHADDVASAGAAHRRPAAAPSRPRQDPRDFYQSEVYVSEAAARDDAARAQMSAVYPELRRAYSPPLPRPRRLPPQPLAHPRSPRREWNDVEGGGGASVEVREAEEAACVRCPAERTVVAGAGAEAVRLAAPRLRGCDGGAAPRGARFLRRYGPALGSQLPAGEHVLLGAIHYNGRVVRECRWRVHVISQRCPLPVALLARCSGARCNLTCADPALQPTGARHLSCGSDQRWSGPLPVCRPRTWCYPPPPPDNGQLSCQSASEERAPRLGEGSRCRARCEPGWRAAPRGAAVCRRGQWTHALACSPKLSRHKRGKVEI